MNKAESVIDIRSDTVTKPSAGMREAIKNAVVGDDVYGEDPTINELQRMSAGLSGKEAALFVTSGCLANQLAIKSQTSPSDEVILESESHILNYETTAPALISGVQVLPVAGEDGVIRAEDIKKYIRPRAYYFPNTSLICLENTHNRAGGTIFPVEEIKKIRELASQEGIRMHLDGARIFNASAETGITVKEYSSYFDSVSFCFSKGLGAPVGSVLCSDEETVSKAHRFRKILGGGMRQAGILAAGAIYALGNNVKRLKEDHINAKYFAKGISSLKDIVVNPDKVQTNIVVFRLNRAAEEVSDFMAELSKKGVLISDGSYGSLRAVFHLDVSFEQAEKAVKIFRELLGDGRSG